MKVIGLGAGGHLKVLLEILSFSKRFKIVGILDNDPRLKGMKIGELMVVGNDALLRSLRSRGISHFILGLGGTGNNGPRRALFNKALKFGLQPLSLIHPLAYVAKSAMLDGGVVVMAGAIINTDARIGRNVIVNSGAIIEHDCIIENHAHISPGAKLAGGVVVGPGAHVGIGAVIKQQIKVGAGAMVGAGSVVIRDVPPRIRVVGVPARELKR